jgi:hypothetical protein
MSQSSTPTARASAWQLPGAWRRVVLLGPPLVLAAWTILHPRPDENDMQAVMDVATWFMTFHVIQLVLLGLVALSVLLLADDFGRSGAWTTRVGVGAFLLFFGSYDSIAGIATGLALRTARDLPPAQQEGVWETVKDWPGFEPSVFSLNVVGTLGWVVAVGALAVAARRAGAPRSQWILIALAAFFLMGGHPTPFGTLAFGCLFLAALLHERSASRAAPGPAAARRLEPSDAYSSASEA